MSWFGRRSRAAHQAFDPQQLIAIERLLSGGDIDAAETQLAALPPQAYDFALAHDIAGRLYLAKHDLPRARASFETALALDPHDVCALCELAGLHSATQAFAQAAALYDRAIRAGGDAPGLQLKRAAVLEQAERFDEAHHAYEAARAAYPYEASVGLGRVARARGDFVAAETAFRAAVDLKRDATHALDVGIALFNQRRYSESIETLSRALETRPDWPEARLVLANALLARGDIAAGWEMYEARFAMPGSSWSAPTAPPWRGQMFTGQTLLIDTEQGFGDSILGMRFIAAARARGTRIVLRCALPLVALAVASSLADEVVTTNENPEAHWHCHILSLPHVLRLSSTADLRSEPYVRADRRSHERWRTVIDPTSFNVGLAWSGRTSAPQNRYRKFDPAPLALRLADIAGVRLYSVQIAGEGVAPCPDGVIDLSAQLDDFAATAGLLERLDLVISADSAVAHLAGAMGVRAWLPYPLTADWRWLIAERESPWYESVSLFHQSAPSRWDDVFAKIATELRALVARERSSR